MGVALTPLLMPHETSIAELKGKVFAVDAFNILYQFLTTIRARDGTPLSDSKGNVTSHLIGLFSRTTNLMGEGLKLVFVFDGEAPELKRKERERRKALKQEAQQLFDAAKAKEDVDEMRKYAGRTARLDRAMVEEARKLLDALGIPCIQAPSEGEAQASYLVKRGDAYAVISQDADAFLFGAQRVIRNLAVTGRKKQKSALAFETVHPERFELDETLRALAIDQERLIALAMLVGTDFNPGGVKGLGPKKALALVREAPSLEELFSLAKWSESVETDWREILKTFQEMPVTDEYALRWRAPDEAAILRLLVDEHEFSRERVLSSLEKLKSSSAANQRGLGEFF